LPKFGYQASFTPFPAGDRRRSRTRDGLPRGSGTAVTEPDQGYRNLQSADLGRAWWEEYGDDDHWFFDLRREPCQRAFQDEHHISQGINLGPDLH